MFELVVELVVVLVEVRGGLTAWLLPQPIEINPLTRIPVATREIRRAGVIALILEGNNFSRSMSRSPLFVP
jgi:hypothetical protein